LVKAFVIRKSRKGRKKCGPENKSRTSPGESRKGRRLSKRKADGLKMGKAENLRRKRVGKVKFRGTQEGRVPEAEDSEFQPASRGGVEKNDVAAGAGGEK